MILTRSAILEAVRDKRVKITPFDPQWVGPNSVDLHIGDEISMYGPDILTTRQKFGERKVIVYKMDPERGFLLRPGVLYLTTTREHTYTPEHVPYVDGRSSTGRLGIMVHITAGRGDLGFAGHWTLELVAVAPVVIYPGDRLAQLTLFLPTYAIGGPKPGDQYAGRYQDQGASPVASKLGDDAPPILPQSYTELRQEGPPPRKIPFIQLDGAEG